MSNVHGLPASTTFTEEQALNTALNDVAQGRLNNVVIIGYNDEGGLYIRSSRMDRKLALWLIKQAELHTLHSPIEE